jgi:hypothetical protein
MRNLSCRGVFDEKTGPSFFARDFGGGDGFFGGADLLLLFPAAVVPGRSFSGRPAFRASTRRAGTDFSRDFGAGFPAVFPAAFAGFRASGFFVFRGDGVRPGAFVALPAGRAGFRSLDFPAGLAGVDGAARPDSLTMRAGFRG